MRGLVWRGVDLVAVLAAAIAVAMAWVYVRLMHSQGDRPLWWVLLVLSVAAALCVAGAPRWPAYRRWVLLPATVLLGLLGLAALLSIGLPILLAALLALLAALRTPVSAPV